MEGGGRLISRFRSSKTRSFQGMRSVQLLMSHRIDHRPAASFSFEDRREQQQPRKAA